MRISTVTMFESGLTAMNRQQGKLMHVDQQLASGRRVVNPSDDPQAASRAVNVSQSMAVSQQYADARISTGNALAQEESVLNSVSDGIASAKTLIIQASSDTLSDADRASVATELKGIYENLLGLANTTNGNGTYLFGGYKDDAPPFVKESGGVAYKGDLGVREQQVDSSRKMPVGDSGVAIFERVHNGAGYVATAGTNNGSVTFTGPTRVDAADSGYGDGYAISFADNAGTLEYTVTNTSTGSTVPGKAGVEYTPGETLSFGGLSITLEGTPVAGDTISMAKAEDQSIFSTLESAIAALDAPAETATEKAARRNTLSTVSRELDNSLDNVLTVRASVGARLNELDVLDSVGGNRSLNYESTLSDLVDLDYGRAITDYKIRQVGLQAAQKVFTEIQGMSLFDRL
ncbi:flagellar hook-associated protein FlgL [Halomonas sp. GXIMD04776]|uniref:flagellar hook-associated protein FlgL n=1 Tax=Halomonas sp. GXIMD04776 TaxID=3415605 RepID=UPI003C9DBA0C